MEAGRSVHQCGKGAAGSAPPGARGPQGLGRQCFLLSAAGLCLSVLSAWLMAGVFCFVFLFFFSVLDGTCYSFSTLGQGLLVLSTF